MTQSTIKSTVFGKAYEYACLFVANQIISKFRPTEIIQNSSFDIAKRCFESISLPDQQDMFKSATAGINTITQLEPKILDDGNDKLTISLQPDNIAKTGDIRDILIIRRSINWEIGISVKHNHAALKHSRLSEHIDFGALWLGTPCSSDYFDTIRPIFASLIILKQRGAAWEELASKEDNVYLPVLNAFVTEFKSLFDRYNEKVTNGIVTYLLGSNGKDYYKLIHHNNHKIKVVPFNINGTLNQISKDKKPNIKIPKIKLPTRIIELKLKEKSKTTVELVMNNGWAISFRIHNASKLVEPSLKFDIQLIGQPADMFYIETEW